MINWNNMDQLSAYAALKDSKPLDLAAEMGGQNGAARVKNYTVPVGGGMDFNYGARPVDDAILEKLAAFAAQTQLAQKFEALYNGAVINTGENRLVLHHLCRGQLGNDVVADGVNKREFYVDQLNKIKQLVKKVHNGELTNAAGETFTTVVQIGIGGILQPMYDLIISNRIENRKLAALRDAILPQLMSGELDVSNLT